MRWSHGHSVGLFMNSKVAITRCVNGFFFDELVSLRCSEGMLGMKDE